MLIHLRCGGTEATLAPHIGGAIASLRSDRRDILRPASPAALAAGDPLGMSEFPMAPYVNRVRDGRFSWRGRRIVLERAPGDAHALHAIAWRRPWDVAMRSDDAARLVLVAPATPAWPFTFTATRTFSLRPDGLTIEFEIRSLSRAPMPAALGFHFYFPKAGAVLRADATGGWETDDASIPRSFAMAAETRLLGDGAPASSLELDHCFTGWDGRARIDWPAHGVSIATNPAQRYLQIYAPRDGAFFCVEPQSAMPDALNRDREEGGVRALSPGENFTVVAQLSVS